MILVWVSAVRSIYYWKEQTKQDRYLYQARQYLAIATGDLFVKFPPWAAGLTLYMMATYKLRT